MHDWDLYANDTDPRMCIMRSNITMASLYGPNFPHMGPVFRRINMSTGAILDAPVVSFVHSLFVMYAG